MIKLTFKFFKSLFSSPPKWRLVPDKSGTYTLEKWNSDIGGYLCKAVNLTPERADKVIAKLERETLYYREETNKAP